MLKNKKLLPLLLLIILFSIPACQKESTLKSNKVVIAISSEINSVTPLYAVNYDEGIIMEQLYPALVRYEWNYKTGEPIREPMLAQKWAWNKDSSSVTFYLRKNAKWSDGKPVTASDVVFSFDVYSDPQVQSRFYGSFKSLDVDSNQHIVLNKTFKIVNPYEITINFKKGSVPSFSDIDLPILPEHMFNGIKRKNYSTAEKDLKLVSDGPFNMDKWEKNQAIFLKVNKSFIYYNKNGVNELIFKIIPDYNSQITQLKNGEVDFAEDVKADDIPSLLKTGNLKIDTMIGRSYDYIGWNNINPGVYKKSGEYVANKLFGDPLVRRALTYALNRKEVVEQFLDNYGQLAVGPIAPIFKSAIDSSLKPYPYNIAKAKELLAKAGWKDVNNEGVLSKGNQRFSFTLDIPSGNPRREFAAALFKNNLRSIGIDMKIESLEPSVFFPKMYKRQFNAWMAGWSVAIPILIKPFWYSSMPDGAYNIQSYRNKNLDKVIDEIESSRENKVKDNLYKKFQQILDKDQPDTFLYWVDNIIVYNKRIKNVEVNPLGELDNCWQWEIKQ